MKIKIFVFFISCLLSQMLEAQQCSGFFTFEPDTQFEMTYYDKKGKVSSYAEFTVEDLSEMDGVRKAEMRSVHKDKNREVISEHEFRVECGDEGYKMELSDMMNQDFLSGMQDMELEFSGTALQMPNELNTGQSLPDAEAEIKVKNNGFQMMTLRYAITNRKVAGQESIETAAGTFDCYKITYDFEFKSIMKKKMKVVQWIAKDIGVVKAEYYNKKGKLENYEELTKFVKP